MFNKVWKVWGGQSVRTTLKEFRECECSFEPHRMRGYGHFSRRPHTLFTSQGAAALSRTHRSRSRLHGVVAAFVLSVFSSVFAPGSKLFLAPITILLFCRRNNEAASTTTALNTIKLCKCTQLFVNRIFCIPKWDGCLRTSHTFNCIPEAWQIVFLKRDTTPHQPRTRTARLVASC